MIINNGTGAGGSNTNYYGKIFEEKTNNESKLLEQGYIKKSFLNNSKNIYDYYLEKEFEDKIIIFVLQYELKKYIKNKYNIDLFRCPDEAYIIEYKNGNKIIKILEKKEQNVNGSVETKLWSCPSLKREYELVLLENNVKIEYYLCVNNFLKNKLISNDKKYMILNIILNENDIKVLFGEDENYFILLNNWINN